MLPSLQIVNFRNLKDLRLPDLKRVNLITGKNNTGKSSILDAVWLYAKRGDVISIKQLLEERGEYIFSAKDNEHDGDTNIKAFSTLFTGRAIEYTDDYVICIGACKDTLIGPAESIQDFITIRFVKFSVEILQHVLGFTMRNRVVIEPEKMIGDNVLESGFLEDGIEVKRGSSKFIIPVNQFNKTYGDFLGPIEDCEYIGTSNIEKDVNSLLWDKILLTDKETYVIEALNIIEPKVERLAYIDDARVSSGSKARSAIIKLKNSKEVVPLKSMGDGINRILTIVLGMVNCENGYLLIDEFENGLHYTVQEQLWSVILQLAERLNIQVFATTHSEDCIASFQKVLNTSGRESQGKLIRLEYKDGVVVPVEYDAQELKIANDFNIETR